MTSSSSFMSAIDKLDGRDNFETWKFAVENYLEHEKLWECVLGTEQDEDKNKKAKAKLVLLVKPVNFVYIRNCKTAKEIWEQLNKTFADTGLSRRVNLIRELTSSKLEDCKNVEDYVNKVMSAAHKLNTSGGAGVSDEWIGSFLLAGLPAVYNPMIMAIESSGMAISGDFVKAKLLQDSKTSASVDSARALFSSKSRNKYNNKSRSAAKNMNQKPFNSQSSNSSNTSHSRRQCYTCSQYGHISINCPQRKKTDNSLNFKKSESGLCVGFSTGVVDNQSWVIDSGATFHMTMRDDWIVEESEKPINTIRVANNSLLDVNSAGKVFIDVNRDGTSCHVPVSDVLHVSDLSINLLSVSQMVKKGHKVIFDNSGCKIFNNERQLIATGSHGSGLFTLDVINNQCLISTGKDNFNLWHRRMGHLNRQDLAKLPHIVTGIHLVLPKVVQPCIECMKGKQSRFPFSKQGTKATSLLELVHSDLCGPMEDLSLGGARYFITFIDDFSRKVFVYILESKTMVRETFEIWKLMAENQTGNKINEIQPRSSKIAQSTIGNTIKILRTDNGSEYVNRDFENFLKKSGIRFQTSNYYTPQQNGLAERMNRTIVEKGRCMIFDANLSKDFWAEAVNTAVYIINRSPAKGLDGQTPEAVWSGKTSDLSHMKVFGCRAMVHVPKQLRKKWDAKSQEYIFVGYCQETKGYRLIDPVTKKLTKSRDVVFLENEVIANEIKTVLVTDKDQAILQFDDAEKSVVVEAEKFWGDKSISGSTVHEEFDLAGVEGANNSENDASFVLNVPTVVQPGVRRSEREPKPKIWTDFVTYSAYEIVLDDPNTVAEALSRHDGQLWKNAILDEYNSLLLNDTWDLVDLPPDRKAINCKWVFKTKRGADGTIVRHKARLVIKGFAQRRGIDYEETYSPVVRYNSLRYLLSLAVQYDMDIEQMDAVTAFLQGEIDEEIYMVQPAEFAKNSKVCRLKKAIYGLKQASRQWNKKLDLSLKEIGFQQSRLDPCVYFKINVDKRTYVAVYVDDFMIFSNDAEVKQHLKSELHKRFEMKDLGEAKYCLGIRITRDRHNGIIYLDQQRHILDLLTKFNMENSKPVGVPADPNQKLSKAMSPKTSMEREEMSKIPYQEAVGGILYVAQGTRPDITYAVNSVSRFNGDPGRPHWEAVKRILRYLKGTSDAKLTFSKGGNSNLYGYCDADWACDEDERRSCTGYVFIKQGGAISWNSKRQTTIALSSAEAEYMALSSSIQEALWFRQFQMNLDSVTSCKSTRIYCDNRSAIDLSYSTGYNARTKHIDIRHHFIRQTIQDKQISVDHVGTDQMVADVFTKPLSGVKHLFCSQGLGMKF